LRAQGAGPHRASRARRPAATRHHLLRRPGAQARLHLFILTRLFSTASLPRSSCSSPSCGPRSPRLGQSRMLRVFSRLEEGGWTS
jgi:hypothetical protein